MTITIALGDNSVTDFTLDETFTLQNSTATPAPAGDADDEDISRATLTLAAGAFDNLIFNTLGLSTDNFAQDGRIAASTTNLYKVTSTGTITDISLSGKFNANGPGPEDDTVTPLPVYNGSNQAAGGATNLSAIDGGAIRLFSDILANPADPTSGYAAAAGLGGNVVFGIDTQGHVVLAIYMKETVISATQVDLQFFMLTFEAIVHPTGGAVHDEPVDLDDFLSLSVQEKSGFDFSVVPSGKINFLMAPALDGSGGALLVSSLTDVNQINTSQASQFGVTIGWGSQGINAGETVVFTFIQDGIDTELAIPNLSQKEAKDAAFIKFGNLKPETTAQFTIAQTVGSATHALKLSAWESDTDTRDGANFFAGMADDDRVGINSVTFTRGSTVVTRTTDGSFGSGVSINFISAAEANGTTLFEGQVVITGFLVGDKFSYNTTSAHTRLDVTGVSGNFDVGQFTTTASSSAFAPIGDAFVIEDAGPLASVVAAATPGKLAALFRNLDETINPDGDKLPNGGDNYVASETESVGPGSPALASNGDRDDVVIGGVVNLPSWTVGPDGFQTLTSKAIGYLDTSLAAGGLAALFDTSGTNFGTDGEFGTNPGDGRTDTLSLVLASPQKTNMVATPVAGSPIAAFSLTAREIWLVKISDTVVEGKIAGSDGIDGSVTNDEFTIFRITLVNPNNPATAYLAYENFAPVVHSNPLLSDEEKNVLLASTATESLKVKYTVTAKDKDLDTHTASAEVTLIDKTSTVVSIDDDGPGTSGLTDDLLLWEDGLPGGLTDNDGEPEATVAGGNVADQVVGGSDGISVYGLKNSAAAIQTLTDQAITSGGVALVYTVDKNINAAGDDKLTARKGAGGTIIFEVVVEEDGDVIATLKGPIDHAQNLGGQPDEDVKTVNLSGLLEAFEGDGDLVQFVPNALRLLIEDDAPKIDDIINKSVNFGLNNMVGQSGFLHYGADGPGGFIIKEFTDLGNNTLFGTITETLSANKQTLTYTSSIYGDMFELKLDGTGTGSYTFKVLQDPPLVLLPLVKAGTSSGGPVETFPVVTPGLTATFDGFLFTAGNISGNLQTVFAAGNRPDGDSSDDVNISTPGIGLKDNQIDPGEGVAIFFSSDVEGLKIKFDGGTGGNFTNFIVRIQAFDGVNAVADKTYDPMTLPKGNNSLTLDFLPGVSFDQIYIVTNLPSPNGIRIPEISTFTKAVVPDFDLTFLVEEFDNDRNAAGLPNGDAVTDSFTIHVEGDGIP